MYSISARCIGRPQRLCGLAQSLSTSLSRRSQASPDHGSHSSQQTPRDVAVVGGGLTGLTTAFWLSKFLDGAKVTLYEASDRLGGWIDTKEVPVTTPDGRAGTVHFERGARMIQIPRVGSPKWDDMMFWELVTELDLTKELRFVPKSTPLKAFVYYPDHIVEMPSPASGLLNLVISVLREPVFRGLLPAAWNIYRYQASQTRAALPAPSSEDGSYYGAQVGGFKNDNMSLGEYYARASGNPDLVNNLLSAMIHGIWGGDVWTLSNARDPGNNTLDRPWTDAEGATWTILSNEETDPALMVRDDLGDDGFLARLPRIYSHASFKKGFSTLANAIVAELEKNPNVTIHKGTPIESIRLHTSGSLAIKSSRSAEPELYDKVVATVFAKTLASLTNSELPALADSHAVTIMAVNLWYPTPGLNTPYHGAGYLIPQSVNFEQNPECALGVLFDSDREFLQIDDDEGEIAGTKLTVLIGGHYWDGIPADQLPSEAEAIEMAKSLVARHLSIPQHENDRAVASAKLCRECIPQHYVGHWSRMAKAKWELQAAFGGKLAVAGPSYQMPGVFGSIRAGRDIAAQISGKYAEPNRYLFPVGDTGLDRFANEKSWNFVRKGDLPWRYPRRGYTRESGRALRERGRALEAK